MTVSGYFINYFEKLKEYRFYYPNHNTRIVEYDNAQFIEDGLVSGSLELWKMDIKETLTKTSTASTSSQIVVPLAV